MSETKSNTENELGSLPEDQDVSPDVISPRPPPPEMRKKKSKRLSLTMEYFLETAHLDKSVTNLLQEYDTDGDGVFSKDEVVAIIVDLKEQSQAQKALELTNRQLKKLLAFFTALFVLLLLGMFGLSFAVVALTANTKVSSDGTLMAKNQLSIIATDDRATKFALGEDNVNSNGVYCMTEQEAKDIQELVLTGRKVLLELNQFNGSTDSTLVHQLQASGSVLEAGSLNTCYTTPTFSSLTSSTNSSSASLHQNLCIRYDEQCNTNRRGKRKLESTSGPTPGPTPEPEPVLAFGLGISFDD